MHGPAAILFLKRRHKKNRRETKYLLEHKTKKRGICFRTVLMKMIKLSRFRGADLQEANTYRCPHSQKSIQTVTDPLVLCTIWSEWATCIGCAAVLQVKLLGVGGSRLVDAQKLFQTRLVGCEAGACARQPIHP
jgi:hypothetical protein